MSLVSEKRKEKANKYGLNVNNPLLNWEEEIGSNGSLQWYNPVTGKYAFTDPFLKEKVRKETASKYGLNVNNPLLNWEERIGSNGSLQWYNPVTRNYAFTNPFLKEKERKEHEKEKQEHEKAKQEHENALKQRLPSFLNEVQQNVRRRSSSVNSTDFLIDPNTQNAISQIKSKYTGALCDSEGFYQHHGECWNDAISMIFLFTDGLKEVVQEKLAKNDVDINFIPKESIILIINIYNDNRDKLYDIFKNIKPELIPPALTDNEIIESLLFYIMFLKNRFVRHYLMESERRQQQGDEVCTLNKNPKKVLHSMGKNAVLSALFGNPGKKTKNLEDYISHKAAGAGESAQTNLIKMLIATFFPKGKYDIINKGFISYEEALTIKSYIYAIQFGTKNHALCFYTCGGNDFFYEDNYGPFLFPWREILFSNKETLEIGITSIIFTRLNENRSQITTYYPVIRLKNDKYFTFYNKKLYTFPLNIFDLSSNGPTLYSFDDNISFSFDYADDKIITFANNIWMSPIIKETGLLQNLNVSNRGFTFKRSRLSNNDYKKVKREKIALKYGLKINNPLLNWQELKGNNGSLQWYNPIIKKFSFTDPFLKDKIRKETASKYGLNVNNPLLNWEEEIGSNGSLHWYNPVTGNFAFTDPFLKEKVRKETASKYGLNVNNPLLNWEEKIGSNGSLHWYNPVTGNFAFTNPFLAAQAPVSLSENELIGVRYASPAVPAPNSQNKPLNSSTEFVSINTPIPVSASLALPASASGVLKKPSNNATRNKLINNYRKTGSNPSISLLNRVNPYKRYKQWKNTRKLKGKMISSSLLNRVNPYTRYKKWKNARRTETRKINYTSKQPSFWNKINPFRRK